MKHYFLPLVVLIVLVSCNPDKKEPISQDEIKTNIIGKWKLYSTRGKVVPTNERAVFTFNQDGTGTQTMSSQSDPITGKDIWYVRKPMHYEIQNTTLHTWWENSSIDLEWLATIIGINADTMATDSSRLFVNKTPQFDIPKSVWKRVHVDYAEDIIGLWEGVSSIEGGYGDEHHRWLFNPNKTYTYFNQTDTGWIVSPNTLNEYAVDGDFLAFRWKANADSAMDREWWDVVIQDDTLMIWTGIRTKEDGAQYTSSFTLRRISPTKAKVEQYLLGKWIVESRDGISVLTNAKSVHTFLPNGKVVYSIANAGEQGGSWYNQLSLSYNLYGNYLTESGKDAQGKTVEPYRSHFNAINDKELHVLSVMGLRLGEISLRRISDNINYANDIIGTWEGIASSNGVYGDYHHRWKYATDGTYQYMNWEDNQWIPVASNNGQYMVDGDWMACRWTNTEGKMDYEWWDIVVQNDTMRWNALREDDKTGETYQSIFVMKRIKE